MDCFDGPSVDRFVQFLMALLMVLRKYRFFPGPP